MEHLKSGRASQAMALLYEIASANHPRFSEMARRAVDLQQRIGAEAERQARSLEQVSARAASFAADSRFREAAELLHSVPREQRTSEMAATLARCEEKLAEIRDLKEQVRRLAGAGEVGRELVDLLHALRNLTPHDSAVSAACEKAESRYRIQSQHHCQNAVKAAEAFLAQKAYAKAVAILDQVPESFRSATWRDRQREASLMQAEYEFLARHLRGSKVVDGATRSLLRRLSELAPGDGPAKQLAALDVAIQRRVERGLSPPSVWTAAPTPGEPQRIPFGKLTGVQVSNDALAMRDQFGVFAVALGLAIQGLGLGEIECNLAPPPPQGLFARRRGAGDGVGSLVWAIDLGAQSCKALLVEREDSQLVVHQAHVFTGEEPSRREVPVPTATAEMAARVLETCDLAAAEGVIVGLSGAELFSRTFTAPSKAAGKKLQEIVRREALSLIPFPPEQVVWGAHTLDAERERQEVMVFAVKRAAVNMALAPWTNIGVEVSILQNNAVALYNLLSYAADKSQLDDDVATAIWDVGAQGSDLVLRARRRLWRRRIDVCGADFTKAVQDGLRLQPEQAIEVKTAPGDAECVHRLYEAWSPMFQSAANELERSLAYLQRQAGASLGRVFYSGGCLQLHGFLDSALRFAEDEDPTEAALSTDG